MIVSFSGHRPDKICGWTLPNPTYVYICQEIEKNLKALQPEKTISGMALGVDQWSAWISHRLGIPFIAAVPFEGQEKKWPAKSQKLYHKLISLASEVIIVSPGGYSAEKMQVRNCWMVDNSDKLLAIYNGDKTGGTANCINYARSVKKAEDIIVINPTLPAKNS